MDHLSSVTSSTGALPRFDFARKASLARLFRGGHDALGVVFGRSPITRGSSLLVRRQAHCSGESTHLDCALKRGVSNAPLRTLERQRQRSPPMSPLSPPAARSAGPKRGPIHAVMVTPETYGGHARYTWELMCALRASAPRSEFNLSLVTSRNLEREFRDADYTIYEVLRPLYQGAFPSSLHWAASRFAHYRQQDLVLFRFLRDLGDVDVVHFQEEPLFAPYYYARLRRLGMHPLYTVHNLLPHRDKVPGTGWFTKWISTAAWRRCSSLFVHSDGLRQQLLERLGGGAPPIVTIPHGLWRVPRATQPSSEDRPQR